MINTFNNAIVLITGGASGIGRSLAIQLKRQGATVIVADRSQAPDMDIECRVVEMTNEHAVKRFFDETIQRHGRIDYVFNCAGIFMAGEIRDTPLEHWKTVVNNNIWAVYTATHFAYQAMLPFEKGHIINVASATGLFPVPIMGIYGSSKFAIVGLSHELRNEAKEFNINVSVVCPTIVNTPLYDTAIYNNVDTKKALKNRDKLQTPDAAAEKIIKGVLKNKATIHTAFSTKIGWWMYRFVPALYNVSAKRVIRNYRATLRTTK